MTHWLTIQNFSKYEISNSGLLRTKRSNRIKKCTLCRKGYYKAYIVNDDNKYKTVFIHRIVALHFIKNLYNKPCVNHIDGNKENNNFTNLEWVSNSENMQHASKIGLMKKGEDSPTAKLCVNDIIKIRTLRRKGETYRKISEKFGVQPNQIRKICIYKAWKHIP